MAAEYDYNTASNQLDLGWDPGFEANRWVVVSRFGLFQRIYQRSVGHVRRFHQKLHHIPITDWDLNWNFELLSGICKGTIQLDIRIQPTLDYVRQNPESLGDLSSHVQNNMDKLLREMVELELQKIETGRWLKYGMESIEAQIENQVNELLVIHEVQCRTRCRLSAEFETLTEQQIQTLTGHYQLHAIYLELLRNNHVMQERHAEERFSLSQQARQQESQRKQDEISQLKIEQELLAQKDREMTRQLMAELSEEERRHALKRKSEGRKREDEIKHLTVMNEMETEAQAHDQDLRIKTAKQKEFLLQRELELLKLEEQKRLMQEKLDAFDSI